MPRRRVIHRVGVSCVECQSATLSARNVKGSLAHRPPEKTF
jgi:hypothetical protein